jgi:hypothetical protein
MFPLLSVPVLMLARPATVLSGISIPAASNATRVFAPISPYFPEGRRSLQGASEREFWSALIWESQT